jgi:hypothetical protein
MERRDDRLKKELTGNVDNALSSRLNQQRQDQTLNQLLGRFQNVDESVKDRARQYYSSIASNLGVATDGKDVAGKLLPVVSLLLAEQDGRASESEPNHRGTSRNHRKTLFEKGR